MLIPQRGVLFIFYLAWLGFWEVGCTDEFFQGKSENNKYKLGNAKARQANYSVVY